MTKVGIFLMIKNLYKDLLLIINTKLKSLIKFNILLKIIILIQILDLRLNNI